jgi:hypothetical protein
LALFVPNIPSLSEFLTRRSRGGKVPISEGAFGPHRRPQAIPEVANLRWRQEFTPECRARQMANGGCLFRGY